MTGLEVIALPLIGMLISIFRGAYIMPGGIDAHVHLCQDLKTGKPSLKLR